MFSFSPTSGMAASRRTPVRKGWLAAALFSLPLSGVAAAQGYPQPGAAPQQGQYAQDETQQDPPSRVARLSMAQGNISVQPASVQDFSPAEVNYPLTTGDRVWSDAGSLAELQIGSAAVRLGQQTDFTVTGLTDTLAQFGLAQGSIHLRTYDLDQNSTTELDTPNAAVTVLAPGDLRVDVYPSNNTTVVTLLSGAAQVSAEGVSQQLQPGESLQVSGGNPAYAQDVRRQRPDGLDAFSNGQDSSYDAALASENSYVSGDTIGAQDLGNYGDWNPDPDYGPVWYPRSVPVGWQPYRYGHWAWIAPWGWTWVESEPWGFAPFHYGRWGQFGGRWGWIPGPRVVRPVYSPALVVFVGGPEFSARLGFGGPGAGVAAWFPLGPREPFQPWYTTSDRYVTRVNVSNIYYRNPRDAQAIWSGRAPSPFRPDPNRQYVNRTVATVAMPQNAFASGRPVQGSALRVDSRQFGDAPVIPHPMVSPTRAIVVPAPARALPPRIARPVLQAPGGNPQFGQGNGGGFRGNQPGNNNSPQQDPIRGGPVTQGPVQLQRPGTQPPAQQTPVQRPGNTNAPTVVTQPGNPGYHAPVGPERGQFQPGTQAPAQTPAQQAPVQRPGSTNAPTVVTQPGNPGYHAPVGPERGQFQPGTPQPPANTPGQPLVNRAQPPQPRPNFEQQRQEMERGDPGRPLSPQQLNNMQQNRPAGPPAQREAVPHPAPQPQAQPKAPAPPPPGERKPK